MAADTGPGEVLWAMDLAPVYPGGPDQPVLAHRIVATRQEQYRGEVRTSACGQEFTAGTHPQGWWSTRGDNLPLQRPYVHCGVPEVKIMAADTETAVKHGTRYTYRKRGCRCDQCRTWKRERERRYRARNREKSNATARRWADAHPKEHQAMTRHGQKKLNDKLRETADRHHQEWTGVELEIASRPDLTARQVAVILHRTLSAVRNMRQRLASDLDPRDRMLANGPQPPTSRSGPR